MMRLSVVLPVYLNRRHLPELYRRLTTTLATSADHEFVFVDDKGADGSLEWLLECRDRDVRVVVVEMPHNVGQHQAVLAGMQRSSGDLVVVMDADLQDPPEEVPRLAAALGTRNGVVFARREARYQSWGRHLTGQLFKQFLRHLAGSGVPIGAGMFFVASRPVVDAAVAMSADARYVPLLLDQTGATMTAIPISKDLARDQLSSYTGAHRLGLALGAIRQAVEWRLTMRRMRSR